ncbi:porin [Methylobacterium sp. C25]|uniref:outer membrane beta-barrel protein n=1 Tax=Methylobacterium sp. C25 TaxID=2721622 RepID=UPI001F32A1E0|nr:outer membrane beta-barrel protein [Methylobacterium sp. C25]MCE4225643.1 porin [Methylobacterium sp. C25]
MAFKTTLRATTAVLALLATGSAYAADMSSAAPAPVPAAPEHCKATISTPAYGPTIKANPNPSCFASPIGDIYVGGAVTGVAYNFSPPFNPGSATFPLPFNTGRDEQNRVDFTNLMATIQKPDGPFQFYVQAGLYSFPLLGFPLYSSFDQNSLFFGPVPIAYGKYQINDEWSVQAGRMFGNIGSEGLFTYQRMNISGGLLFNQEIFLNQGVQVNYSSGPWNASVAVTDGFFSGELNWVTGLVTYKIDDNNTIGINGGTHFNKFNSLMRGSKFQYATPNTLQNSSIVSVNYTYANGPWTITPYAQYTSVERDLSIGNPGAETYGGAVLAAYSFTDWFSLAGRVEYIGQNGSRISPFGVNNLLYGAGSSAVSYTVTPTFNFDRFFVRGEYSHVDLYDIQRSDLANGLLGTGFGRTGDRKSQDRFMVEAGFTF